MLNNISVLSWDDDVLSDNYDNPETYSSNGVEIHHTRILYFSGESLASSQRRSNQGNDDSVLQSTWEAIRERKTFDTTVEKTAQMLFMGILNIGSNEMSKAMAGTESFAQERTTLIAKARGIFNMIVLGGDESYTVASHSVGGISDLDKATMTSLTIASGMPEQLFVGTAPGGLNADGESHRSLWNNTVSDHQQDKYKNNLMWLYEIAGFSGFDIVFAPLDELTETQLAALHEKRIKAATEAVKWDLVTPNEARVVITSGGSISDVDGSNPIDKTVGAAFSSEAESDYQAALDNMK